MAAANTGAWGGGWHRSTGRGAVHDHGASGASQTEPPTTATNVHDVGAGTHRAVTPCLCARPTRHLVTAKEGSSTVPDGTVADRMAWRVTLSTAQRRPSRHTE